MSAFNPEDVEHPTVSILCQCGYRHPDVHETDAWIYSALRKSHRSLEGEPRACHSMGCPLTQEYFSATFLQSMMNIDRFGSPGTKYELCVHLNSSSSQQYTGRTLIAENDWLDFTVTPEIHLRAEPVATASLQLPAHTVVIPGEVGSVGFAPTIPAPKESITGVSARQPTISVTSCSGIGGVTLNPNGGITVTSCSGSTITSGAGIAELHTHLHPNTRPWCLAADF
jgi:hypothetical protein